MKNIGNTIKETCYCLTAIIIIMGTIISCIVAGNVGEYDSIKGIMAFLGSFLLFSTFGFSLLCIGALFGYLSQICDLLEDIKNKQ